MICWGLCISGRPGTLRSCPTSLDWSRRSRRVSACCCCWDPPPRSRDRCYPQAACSGAWGGSSKLHTTSWPPEVSYCHVANAQPRIWNDEIINGQSQGHNIWLLILFHFRFFNLSRNFPQRESLATNNRLETAFWFFWVTWQSPLQWRERREHQAEQYIDCTYHTYTQSKEHLSDNPGTKKIVKKLKSSWSLSQISYCQKNETRGRKHSRNGIIMEFVVWLCDKLADVVSAAENYENYERRFWSKVMLIVGW